MSLFWFGLNGRDSQSGQVPAVTMQLPEQGRLTVLSTPGRLRSDARHVTVFFFFCDCSLVRPGWFSSGYAWAQSMPDREDGAPRPGPCMALGPTIACS